MTRGDAFLERRPGQCKICRLVTVTTTAATATTATGTAAAAVFTTWATITAAATTAAAGTFFLRAGNVDRQGAVAKIGAVQGFDCLLGFFRGGHGHEGKTA
jgi:hypothetical protein